MREATRRASRLSRPGCRTALPRSPSIRNAAPDWTLLSSPPRCSRAAGRRSPSREASKPGAARRSASTGRSGATSQQTRTDRPAFAPDPERDPDPFAAAGSLAEARGISRAAQDQFAAESHGRALRARDAMRAEIVPLLGLDHDPYARAPAPRIAEPDAARHPRDQPHRRRTESGRRGLRAARNRQRGGSPGRPATLALCRRGGSGGRARNAAPCRRARLPRRSRPRRNECHRSLGCGVARGVRRAGALPSPGSLVSIPRAPTAAAAVSAAATPSVHRPR